MQIQHAKMVQEDLEAIVAAILAAGAAQIGTAQSAVDHYKEILKAVQEKGVYGALRRGGQAVQSAG